MKKIIVLVIGLLGTVLVLGGCSTGPDMKEGKWEISTEMGLKGIQIKLPAVTTTQCLTKNDLVPQQHTQPAAPPCTIAEQKTDGDTVRWKMVCSEGDSETISEGTITYSGVLFSGTVNTTINGGPVSMNAAHTITGKYLGPCE